MKILSALTVIFLDDMRSWHENPMPDDINGGDCYNWAWIAKKLLPDSELIFTAHLGGHAWIKYQGLFFDAESLEGVSDWRDFPCFKNEKIGKYDSYYLSNEDFNKYWDVNKKNNRKIIKKILSQTS